MERKNWVILGTLVVIASLILSSCGKATPSPTAAPQPTVEPTQPAAPEDYAKADRKDTVIFDLFGGRDNTPELWNPYAAGVYHIGGMAQALVEPFFMLNYETGETVPWLAESATSNETLDVWTLTLRDGATWSDGVPVTADDVIFTFEMLRDHPELRSSAAVSQWVAEMEKVDERTVRFTLTAPNPRFALDFLTCKITWADVSPVPKHIWEGQDPLTFTNYDPEKGWPVFSGPYKLASTSETEVVFVRDDNWWAARTGFQRLPKPKRLIWTSATTDETRVALMADHQLDGSQDITFGAFEALRERNPNVVVWHDGPPYAWPDPCARFFHVNNAKAPWDDPEMRWALNYVINRDQIVEIAYENTTTKAAGIFAAYKPLNDYMALLPQEWIDKLWTTDTDKAAEILTRKGYTKVGDYWEKDGQQLTVEIQSLEGDSESNRTVSVVVEQLQAFGINAIHKVAAWGTYFDSWMTGAYDLQWGGFMTCASVNEPWASMRGFRGTEVTPIGEAPGPESNHYRWANQRYAELIDEMGALPLGDPRVGELFVEAMKVWYEELPAIPLTQAKKLLPYDTTYWTNWPTAQNNYVQPPNWWQTTMIILINLEPAQ